jgi:hypothetical protein
MAAVLAAVWATAVAACGASDTTRQIIALSAAQTSGTQTCSKAGAPTGFDGAILAKTAVVTLRRAGVSPHPWDTVSPSLVVTFCYPTDAIQQRGVYLDSSGRRSIAPASAQMTH